MRVKTWKILDRGKVPKNALTVTYDCPHCGHEAELPVKGRALAQIAGGGIVFDNDQKGEIPPTVQCRKCRRILTTEPEQAADVR